MYRALPYFMLFVIAVLLQVFLFDNLSISVYFNPLIYIVFIILLPLDTPHIVLLGSGLLMGAVMDAAMGTAGINTIATLAVAFMRPQLIGWLHSRDDAREGGIPSPVRFGARVFRNYLVAMVLLHAILFFSLEALSWTYVFHTLARIVVSSVGSIVFIWLIARLFIAKYTVRL
ncbi:MAG: rod shape-determining protein MreD [Alistipes sp.]